MRKEVLAHTAPLRVKDQKSWTLFSSNPTPRDTHGLQGTHTGRFQQASLGAGSKFPEEIRIQERIQ